MATWDRFKEPTTGLEVSLQSGRVFNPRSYCDDPDIGPVGVYISKEPVCKLLLDPVIQFLGEPIAWDISQSRSATGTISTYTIDWGGATDIGNITGAAWSGAKTGNVVYDDLGTYTMTAYVTDLLSKRSKEVEITVEIVEPVERIYIATSDTGVYLMDNGATPAASNTGLSGDQLLGRAIRLDPATAELPAEQQQLIFVTADGLSLSQDGGANWSNTSKATLGTPANTAADDPAPATADLDQIDLCFDPQDSRRVYLLRTTTSPKRAWLYKSDDYGETWSNTQVGS
ncbi:MAG: hypothetical protein BroJett011_04070 [Chloroflexota bacterium]|nr:MAG: hypothetical protein BroJett011_04070 [Chloroflexota bacterium]